MALTNAQMQTIVNGGGSVQWPPGPGGATITTIAGLPSDAAIAAFLAGVPPLFYSPSVVGAAVASSVAETALMAGYTVPANSLRVGQAIHIVARGIYSSFTSGNITLKVKCGSAVLAVIGPVPPAASVTNRLWVLEVDIVVAAIGASGSLECQGDIQINDTATHGSQWALVNTAPVAVDTTVANLLTVTGQWDVNNAANSIQCRFMTIETKN